MTEQKEWAGSGGCLCGGVKYKYKGEPSSVGLCQCQRCQRQSGSSFLIGVIFATEDVEIEGEMKNYVAAVDGESRLWRHFCPTCGSALMITLDRYPDIRSMMGGTLDDKNVVKPTFSIWSSEGQPWLSLPDHIECFPDYPDGTFA